MDIIANKENLIRDLAEKQEFYFCDKESKPTYKTKIVYKLEPKIIAYLHTFSPTKGVISKKISSIEFRGWSDVDKLPRDFRSANGLKIDFVSKRLKHLISFIHRQFPSVKKIIIDLDGATKITNKYIQFNWNDLEVVLQSINREMQFYDNRKKSALFKEFSGLSSKVKEKPLELKRNDFHKIFSLYGPNISLSNEDIDLVFKFVSNVPPSQISVTKNYIATKDKVNIAYLENIINEYTRLLKAKNDNEKEWQKFFEINGWILNNLFPYEVILYQREAYLGGKVVSNKEGRVVDFLFQNGFKDNYALLEIKTHNKVLLKSRPYREPDVYALSEELSGSINQCLDQKNSFMTKMGLQLAIHDPKVILIVGMKEKLKDSQRICFELLRSNQKNIEIVTFDELLEKLKGLLAVLKFVK